MSYQSIITKGSISIFKGGERGQPLLSCEGRGRIIGEMALLDNERRSATCAVKTDCEFLSFSQESLKKLANEYPLIAISLHVLSGAAPVHAIAKDIRDDGRFPWWL